MKSQNLLTRKAGSKFTHTYRNVVDSFGGPMLMADKFDLNVSTIYPWLAGRTMPAMMAIRVHVEKPEIQIKDLIGYELACDDIYLQVLAYFKTQTNAAKSLGLSQATIHTWMTGNGVITLEKATLLEEITRGRFHPSDFPHLVSQNAGE